MTIDKRINFRFGGAYQGGSGAPGSAEAPGKKTSSGTGGSKGNIGGGGGGQESEYRRYEAPTRPTYDSTNIDQKPVTGADFRRSENEFINNLNQNNFLRAQQTNTPFQPYQGGAFAIDRMKQSNPARGIMSLLASVAIPGAGFFLNQGSKLRDGLMGLNNQLQQSDFGRSTSLMDYLDMRKYGGYDEREMARRINMDEARLLQADIDSGLYDGTGEVRPLQTFEFDPSNFNRNIETGIDDYNFEDIEGQVAELTPKQKAFINSQKSAIQYGAQTPEQVYEKITNPKKNIYKGGVMGMFEQEPTTLEEYNNYLQSIGINKRAV
jgi:hypothetical protein